MGGNATPQPSAKGKGIFGALKGMVFEEDVQAQPQSGAPAPAEETESAPAASPTVRSSRTARTAKPTEVNEAIFNKIKAAVLAKTSVFTQLLDQIDALADVGLNEDQKYKAAFASVKKNSKTTARGILEAIDKLHIGALETEETRFTAAIGDFVKEKVGGQQQEAETIAEEISAKKKQIAKLQAEVEELETDKAKADSEVASQTAQVEGRKEEFNLASQAVAGWLKEERDRIATHLVGKGE